MSFTQDTQQKIDTVARKIERVNPTAANRLFRLSAAVGHAPNSMSEAWAATNIQQMIDTQVIAAQLRARDIPWWGLRFLEWLRNLLIFAPLVLTWYGISSAVDAYSAFVEAVKHGPVADQSQLQLPFLYLWQQGFGGHLTNGLILSRLAFIDAIFLFALVVLTGLVNIRSHLRSSRKEQEVEALQEELTDALADAALCLTTTTGQQPTNVADISRQLLNELAKERQRLDDLSTRREKELADLKSFTDALVPISQNMQNGATQISQSTYHLTQTLQNLSSPVQQIVSDMQSMLATMARLLQLQRETSENVKQLVSDQKTWGTDLEDAIDGLTLATNSLNQLPAAINQWTGQLDSLVKQLTIEHQAQTTVSQMTADAAIGLQDALKTIHQSSNNLRGMANDFYTIMNIQKDFPNTVRASLNDVIRDYANAAGGVAQSAQNLAYAAQMLMNVANHLNGGGAVRMHP